jgi:hypothetical protein
MEGRVAYFQQEDTPYGVTGTRDLVEAEIRRQRNWYSWKRLEGEPDMIQCICRTSNELILYTLTSILLNSLRES